MGRRGQPAGAARAATRGMIAAMAMTGMRTMTRGLGLVRRPPPEEIFSEGVPQLLARVPVERRNEMVELAHWAYGAAAGAGFGLLPRPLRARPWAGPAYGLAIWGVFELVLAPLLGLAHTKRRPSGERAAVAADHVLFGLVVGARPHDF